MRSLIESSGRQRDRTLPALRARVHFAVLAVAALVLAVPTAAMADAVTRDIAIARAQWPGSPCAGREQVAFVDSFTAPADADVYGLAYPATCRVEIRRGVTGYELCRLIVHELGHLAGQEHSTDKASPMYPDDDGPPLRECWPPLTRIDLDEASANLPVPTTPATWDVTCVRLARWRARCIARHGRLVLRYSVRATSDHRYTARPAIRR